MTPSPIHKLNAESTLADWLKKAPAVAPILERHELDYCCGGRRTLANACAERGFPLAAVLAELVAIPQQHPPSGTPPPDWSQRPLAELCDHIEQTHHSYLRRELPRLNELLGKVVAAHGERHPEVATVAATFRALVDELGPHLLKEERILFPAIRQLGACTPQPRFPFGSVQNPIRMMEHEHDNAGSLLHELRRLTAGYAPPADACETWRQLLSGLQSLEADLFQHIHKENNVLFPAAARLETQ